MPLAIFKILCKKRDFDNVKNDKKRKGLFSERLKKKCRKGLRRFFKASEERLFLLLSGENLY